MFSIKSLILCLALFVALVSAVPRPIDLYHRSLHALGARGASQKRELGIRSSRRRCQAHSSTKSSTTSKATHHVAEATSSPSPPPKKPTSKAAAKPPPPPPKPASSNNGGGGGGGGTHNGGVATFFFQNGNAGACGQVHSDSDFICAMDTALYGNTGNASPLCGKQVHITNTQNGKSVTVTVADACPTCNNANSIDLSQAAFDAIAEASQGEVPISWSF